MRFNLTTDTSYLALTGALWGVYCEDLGENWPHYNGTALYIKDTSKHWQQYAETWVFWRFRDGEHQRNISGFHPIAGDTDNLPVWAYRLGYEISGEGVTPTAYSVIGYADCLSKCITTCLGVEYRHPTQCTVKQRSRSSADRPLEYSTMPSASTVLDLGSCKAQHKHKLDTGYQYGNVNGRLL